MEKVWSSPRTARAAEVGAEILRKGGNAIDAAVATGMAIGALEPWMSGIGGVGFMTLWSAKEKRAFTVELRAGLGQEARLSTNYKIVGPGPANPFAWPDILNQNNEVGYHSIAVPGMVAGHRQGAGALRHDEMEGRAGARHRARRARHGARLVHAGDDRQRRGAPVEVPGLEGRPTCCDDGRVPTNDWQGTAALPQARQSRPDHAPPGRRRPARILRRQPRARHRRRPAGRRLGDLATTTSPPTRRAIVDPLSFEHHGVTFNVAGGLTAGPTLRRTLELAGDRTKGKGAPDAEFFVAIAEGMHTAYDERLKTLGDKPTNTCTTHFCAADSEGNMVALTQTLMSLFGSGVMLPKTGITMNNGMLWFDPEARPAELDRAGQAAAVQHLPDRRGQGRPAVVLHRRLGRPAHRAGGDAALA